MPYDDEFTVPEAAVFLKVAEETVRRRVRSGDLPASKKGTQWFIRKEELQAFANSYDPLTGKRRAQ